MTKAVRLAPSADFNFPNRLEIVESFMSRHVTAKKKKVCYGVQFTCLANLKTY